MIDHRSRQVLLEELASWHREGLITDDQHEILSRRYHAMAATPVEQADAYERKTSVMLTVLMALGGGMVLLGLLFLVGAFWDDLGPVLQQFICWASALGTYLWAWRLGGKGSSPKSALALTAIANGLLAIALGVTWDCMGWWDYRYSSSGDEESVWSSREMRWVYFNAILAVIYVRIAVRRRSSFLAFFFAVALVAFDLALGAAFADPDESHAVVYCVSTGALIALAAYLISSTPWRCLTAALGSAGLGMVMVTSFIGTFRYMFRENVAAYHLSYWLLFIVPVATMIFGARRNIPSLAYFGIFTLWIALIRLFADVFEDSVMIFVGAILVGVVTIVGAVAWERKRRSQVPKI